jgi:hypothetical protein
VTQTENYIEQNLKKKMKNFDLNFFLRITKQHFSLYSHKKFEKKKKTPFYHINQFLLLLKNTHKKKKKNAKHGHNFSDKDKIMSFLNNNRDYAISHDIIWI